jgi:hypothetical protein
MQRFVLLVFIAISFACGLRYASLAVAGEKTAPSFQRLFTGEDKQSHVERLEMKFSPVADSPAMAESEHLNAATAYLVRAHPGFSESWHNADKRRYVVTLSGRGEIEVAAGKKFFAEPGQLVLAEDLTGKGHTFRVIGNEDWVALFVDFAP